MSSPEVPDAAHTARIQQLFVQHLVPLRGMLHALVPDRARVDDLVQETFLTVTAKAASFTEGTSFRAWVFTIARFKVLKSLQQRPLGEALSEETLEALTASEPEWVESEARVAHLAVCLDKLAPQARRAIELRYQQALRPPEIARVMHWSTGSVKVALCRARDVLRECIERRLATETA